MRSFLLSVNFKTLKCYARCTWRTGDNDVELFAASAQGVDDKIGWLGHLGVVQALPIGCHLLTVEGVPNLRLH